MSDYRIQELQACAIDPWLQELGKLRIRVFRDYPYLYEGDESYEGDYLKRYLSARNALVILVTNSDEALVGATTCLPLIEEGPDFRDPLEQAGLEVSECFYFGESVLLPEWRGRGIGHLFFDRREAHARRLGFRIASFCAVDRSEDDPRRPADYRPLDGFWKKRGYEKQAGLQARFPWKEVGQQHETEQSLTFWLKRLSP